MRSFGGPPCADAGAQAITTTPSSPVTRRADPRTWICPRVLLGEPGSTVGRLMQLMAPPGSSRIQGFSTAVPQPSEAGLWQYKEATRTSALDTAMAISDVGLPGEVPWKKMSAEELENQYRPSQWVVRLGAEEALRTYSQIGIEALPFFLFFHGGYWQSGRHPGPDGRPGDPQRCVCPDAVSKQWNIALQLTLEDAQRNSPQLKVAQAQPVDPTCRVLVVVGQFDSPEFHRQSWEFYQTLCQGEWKASFEQLHDVDHFEIVENLTQKDNVLTQVGPHPWHPFRGRQHGSRRSLLDAQTRSSRPAWPAWRNSVSTKNTKKISQM
nr:kynurenine formamidase isoform X7 [Macaca fascicularis]